MALTNKQRSFLKGKAHSLHPVVQLGEAGLTEAVTAATDEALAHHELIKVRFQQGDREERRALAKDICDRTGADLVQEIGRMAVLFRPAEEPQIQLPAT
ncbi:ribosome assembly RNA-binding protein YhbY [Thiohalorhabdus methylotrophus]|uniref:Ribosome assembly RNA-binding protein YhbY n=1 Tax=Thiohalorhabdus methylotrophus TaxID=3242694 RepID=A0ABV4TWG0_9GAMM